MDSYLQERRGLFDGLKVPGLNLNAIFIAAVAIVVYFVGLGQVESMLDVANGELAPRVMVSCLASLGLVSLASSVGSLLGQSANAAEVTSFLLWTLLVWSVSGLTLCRIAASRLAREEGLSLGESLSFGLLKSRHVIFLVVSVAIACALLGAVGNGLVFGTLLDIAPEGVDAVLAVLFYPLVLISCFVMVFMLSLGALGLGLSTAAIATESSDAYDGLSRSWNYILSRPWGFLSGCLLSYAYMIVFSLIATVFLNFAVTSLSVGGYGLGRSATQASLHSSEAGATQVDKRERLKRRLRLGFPTLDRHLTRPGPIQRAAKTVAPEPSLPGFTNVMNFWYQLCRLAILGYLLNYFFASQTTLYFLLRKEVDGDDYSQYATGDEPEDPFALPPSKPDKQGSPVAGSDDDKGRSLPMVMEV
jgi:hypothetical protein